MKNKQINIGLIIGLGMLKKMLKDNLISESEYNNMVKDFAKRMQQETEAINRRGSFFSGGAIQNEQDIRGEQASALLQQDLQAGAANYSNLASQALLAAEKSEFIRDRLVNSESSAYARWTDQRNFSFQALQFREAPILNQYEHVNPPHLMHLSLYREKRDR